MKFKKIKKEKFCKYCGRELELGRCYCDEFIASASKPKDKTKTITCDTCGSKVDADSIYCSHCGMPLLVDGNNIKLQKELRGDTAKDVMKVYANEMKPRDRFLFPLSFVISISVATLFIGILFGYLIIPEIRKAIFNYNFYKQAEMNNDLYNGLEPATDENEIIESSDENYDAETAEGSFPDKGPVAREIEEPTSPSQSVEATTSVETSSASPQESSVGASTASPSESTKKTTLWLEKATRVDDTVGDAANGCQLLFYYPTINGEDESEIKLLSDLFQYIFYADFVTQVKNYALSQAEPPLSIVFEVPKDQGGSGKIYRVKFTGHVTPRVGIADTIKYTIIYNRGTHDINVQKTN